MKILPFYLIKIIAAATPMISPNFYLDTLMFMNQLGTYLLDWIFVFIQILFFLGFDDEAPPPGQEKTKKKRKSKPNQKIRKRMKLLKEEQGMAEEMDAEWFSINLNVNFEILPILQLITVSL